MHTALFFFFYNLQNLYPLSPSVFVFLAHYLPYLLLTGLLFYLFFARQFPFWKRVFILFGTAASSGLSYLILLIIRLFYQTPRPFSALPDVKPLVDAAEEALLSFPSAHATIFFAIGTFLFFYHKRLGSIYLFAALLVSLARVVAGVHWPLDILAGAALGILGALIIRTFATGIKRYL